MTKIKMGIHVIGDYTWRVGVIYLNGLFLALRETYPDNWTLCLLSSNREQPVPEELAKLADEIVVLPTPTRWTLAWVIDRVTKRVFRFDLVTSLFLRREGVKVVAFGQVPLKSALPTVFWLPDFQHVHLPEMFSAAECRGRDHKFLQIAKVATRVILLSESARRDFQAFAPKYAGKARVVSPVSYIPESLYERDPQSVTKLYSLPDKFVYLPNQFWKHKNHSAVFHALKILKGQGIRVSLVCSGYPGDYRHPTYFAELFQDLCLCGIQNQVAFLGSIPRDHVFMLMRQSICVINPSLFEGYGMTVDEARSVGKQALLSDIPAHREQNPPQAVFFEPRDCEDLAIKLKHIWHQKSPGPDMELEMQARQSLPERRRKYAESFMSVVHEVVD